MILDRALAAPSDKDHLFDPRLARFVDRILDQRPVDDWQHFLGDCLRRGEEAGAEAGDGKDGFADQFHARRDIRKS